MPIKNRRGILIGVFTMIILAFFFIMPSFFLYPNHNKHRQLPPEIRIYFTNLSSQFAGDCYRVCQKFIMRCALESREVHLNSEHTIVEVSIGGKWVAYDPLFDIYFNGKNCLQVKHDLERGYVPDYLQSYEYMESFREVRYYHNYYFLMLKYFFPPYDDLLSKYYTVF